MYGKQNWELSTWHADNNGFLIGSFKAKANRQRTEVIAQFSRNSWGGTRDKPKNVCVGGHFVFVLLSFTNASESLKPGYSEFGFHIEDIEHDRHFTWTSLLKPWDWKLAWQDGNVPSNAAWFKHCWALWFTPLRTFQNCTLLIFSGNVQTG